MLLRAYGVELARRYHLWYCETKSGSLLTTTLVYFASVKVLRFWAAENQQRLVGNGFGDQPNYELENSHKDFLSPAVRLWVPGSVWRVELSRDSLRGVQRGDQGGLPVQPQPGERDSDQLRQRRLSRRLSRPALQILHPGDLTFHWNDPISANQRQRAEFSWWMPISRSSVKSMSVGNCYRLRSSLRATFPSNMSTSATTQCAGSQRDSLTVNSLFCLFVGKISWLKHFSWEWGREGREGEMMNLIVELVTAIVIASVQIL